MFKVAENREKFVHLGSLFLPSHLVGYSLHMFKVAENREKFVHLGSLFLPSRLLGYSLHMFRAMSVAH